MKKVDTSIVVYYYKRIFAFYLEGKHPLRPKRILGKIKSLPLSDQVELLNRRRKNRALKVLSALRSPLLTFHYIKAQPQELTRVSLLPLLEREEDRRYFAAKDPSPLVRFKALSLISSEIRRLDILRKEQDHSNLELALESLLHHSEYQLELINHHKDVPGVRRFIERSSDLSLHIRIACFCVDKELRELSFERLNISLLGDEHKLALLRVSQRQEHIAQIIASLDVNTLCEIVKGGNASVVRAIEAYAHLQNLPQIQRICQRGF